jgi:DNA-binding NtrC family response regulator
MKSILNITGNTTELLPSDFEIIIIEDDAGLNHLIQKKLKPLGYAVQGKLSGAEALPIITCASNELLIIDFKLSDMTGIELLQEIKDKYNRMPNFIIMTGYGDEKTAVEMMKLGASDYLVKESDFLEILPEKIKKSCQAINKTILLQKAEGELYLTNELLEETAKIAKAGGWTFDLANNYFYCSDICLNIHGIEKDLPANGMNIFDTYPEKKQNPD